MGRDGEQQAGDIKKMTERTSNRSLNPAGAYISGGAAGAEGVKIFRNKSREGWLFSHLIPTKFIKCNVESIG